MESVKRLRDNRLQTDAHVFRYHMGKQTPLVRCEPWANTCLPTILTSGLVPRVLSDGTLLVLLHVLN